MTSFEFVPNGPGRKVPVIASARASGSGKWTCAATVFNDRQPTLLKGTFAPSHMLEEVPTSSTNPTTRVSRFVRARSSQNDPSDGTTEGRWPAACHGRPRAARMIVVRSPIYDAHPSSGAGRRELRALTRSGSQCLISLSARRPVLSPIASAAHISPTEVTSVKLNPGTQGDSPGFRWRGKFKLVHAVSNVVLKAGGTKPNRAIR